MEYKDFLNEFAKKQGIYDDLEELNERMPGFVRKILNPKAAKRLKRMEKSRYERSLGGRAEKAAGAVLGAGMKAAKAGAGFVRKHKKATAVAAIGAYAAHRMLRKKCAKKYPPHNEPESYRRCMARLGRD